MRRITLDWRHRDTVVVTGRDSFTCGFCAATTAADLGYSHTNTGDKIVLCHSCGRPTLFEAIDKGKYLQVPGVLVGAPIANLEPNVECIYKEARNSFSIGAYHGVVLLCRSLIMHLAVVNGAKEKERFTVYIDHLDKLGFIPPNGKSRLEAIRTSGGKAAHVIEAVTEGEAFDMLRFAELLLRNIHEFADPPKLSN